MFLVKSLMKDSTLESVVKGLLEKKYEETDLFKYVLNKSREIFIRLKNALKIYGKESSFNYDLKTSLDNIEEDINDLPYSSLASSYLYYLNDAAVVKLSKYLFGNDYRVTDEKTNTLMFEYLIVTNYFSYFYSVTKPISEVISSVFKVEYSKSSFNHELLAELNNITTLIKEESLNFLVNNFKEVSDKNSTILEEYKKSNETENAHIKSENLRLVYYFENYLESVNDIILKGEVKTTKRDLLSCIKKYGSKHLVFVNKILKEYNSAVILIPEYFKKFVKDIDVESINKFIKCPDSGNEMVI